MVKTRKSVPVKLPKIEKMESGAYHARVYLYTDENGKQVIKSLTSFDYNELVQQIVELKLEKKYDKENGNKGDMTLHEAIDSYIDGKSAVLSPSTLRGYRNIQKNGLKTLMNIYLRDITQVMVQRCINEESVRLSPKSIRNEHGLLAAVLASYRPELILHTTLPKKVKPDIVIPTENEIKQILSVSHGDRMEIPIILGACCGMRRSEICALTWRDIDFKKETISISKAQVLSEDGKDTVIKGTKTAAGKRIIKLFPEVMKILKEHKGGANDNDRVTVGIQEITAGFRSIQRKAFGEVVFRFHDLRHYLVSVMLSLNIPKKYIADYVGHETEDMIDQVYGHIMLHKKTQIQDLMQTYFSDILKN